MRDYDCEPEREIIGPTGPSRSRTPSIVATLTPDVEEQPFLSGKHTPTPLPVFQLAILCVVLLSEPIAYTQIFPYINQMVEELHLTDKAADIGFYSGLVDSLFAAAQLMTIYQWGRLSDRIGRRPVLITGLLGGTIASFSFGLSGSPTQMILSRAFAGALSGNIAIVNSAIGEITDETNQAKAFPLTGAFWCIGVIIGPLIGGTLSHPAERYPNIFGQYEFLKDRPHFLPCFVTSILVCLSMMAAIVFLEESLPSKVASAKLALAANESSPRADDGSTYGATTPAKAPVTVRLSPTSSDGPTSTLALLRDGHVRGVLTACFLLQFTWIGYETVWVLWAYTPLSLGGIERTPSEIGYILAITGFSGTLLFLFAYPALNARFGTLRLYAYTMSLWTGPFIIISTITFLARILAPHPLGMDVMIWCGLSFMCVSARLAAMSFSGNMIMVKSAAPNQESLGALFGLSQSVACIARSISPAFVSSLFAISIDKQILNGYFVWVVMLAIAIAGIYATRNLKELS